MDSQQCRPQAPTPTQFTTSCSARVTPGRKQGGAAQTCQNLGSPHLTWGGVGGLTAEHPALGQRGGPRGEEMGCDRCSLVGAPPASHKVQPLRGWVRTHEYLLEALPLGGSGTSGTQMPSAGVKLAYFGSGGTAWFPTPGICLSTYWVSGTVLGPGVAHGTRLCLVGLVSCFERDVMDGGWEQEMGSRG